MSDPFPWGDVVPGIVAAIFLISLVFVVKIISDNRVRRAAVEKGLVDENVRYLWASAVTGFDSLKWGMVFIAVGLAFVMALIYPRSFAPALFIFCGLALIWHYRMVKRQQQGGAGGMPSQTANE